MKLFEVAAQAFGRQLIKLSFTIKECNMPETKKARIEIIDSHGIGYAAGKEYDVDAAEAKRLIDAKKAKPVTEKKTEKATAKNTAVEKR